MKLVYTLFISSFILFSTLGFSAAEQARSVSKILTLKIYSSINPATLSYVTSGFEHAQKEQFDLIVIKINTPGGLVSTTKDILALFGQSEIPVLVWVTPEGASATSAGAIIAAVTL